MREPSNIMKANSIEAISIEAISIEADSTKANIKAARYLMLVICSLLGLLLSISPALAQSSQSLVEQWRTESLSPIDQQYMREQRDRIDELARRHFGRQLNDTKANDFQVLQRLLDDGIVGPDQTLELQAMGLILGELLKSAYSLRWVVYFDQYGRSRSLQVPGKDKEFIFPATQISRKAEVGIRVDVAKVYAELEEAVTIIRNKPPF